MANINSALNLRVVIINVLRTIKSYDITLLKTKVSKYLSTIYIIKTIYVYSTCLVLEVEVTIVGVLDIQNDEELLLTASSGRMLLLHTGAVNLKTSRSTQGVAVMKLKKGQRLMNLSKYAEGTFSKPSRYRTKTLPALGALPAADDTAEQLTII